MLTQKSILFGACLFTRNILQVWRCKGTSFCTIRTDEWVQNTYLSHSFYCYPICSSKYNRISCISSGKKEKSVIAEHEKICTDKIIKLEESLKKKKQVWYKIKGQWNNEKAILRSHIFLYFLVTMFMLPSEREYELNWIESAG